MLKSLIIVLLSWTIIAQKDEDTTRKSKGRSPPKQQAFIHPLTNMPDAAIDVKTTYFFPKHTDQKFPIGETVTVLCHIINDGQFTYNVTAIMGSLNSPYDFSFHIQNYSYKPFGIVIKAGEEYTFDYQFQLHQNLEPVEYALAHTIFYEDDSESFSSTFFNQTIELYYPNNDYDLETIAQLLFSLFATLFVASMLYFGCSTDPKVPDFVRKFKFSSHGPTQAEEDEWTSEHVPKTARRLTKSEFGVERMLDDLVKRDSARTSFP
eukprot:gene8220-16897_t